MTGPVHTLVSASDVCTVLAREVPDAGLVLRAQLDELCVQAAAEIRHRVPAVDARLTAGSLSAVRVRGIACDMVIAALENVELGFRSTGESYPELGTTQVAAANRMLVEMTDSQRAALMPPDPLAGADGRGGMFFVPLS